MPYSQNTARREARTLVLTQKLHQFVGRNASRLAEFDRDAVGGFVDRYDVHRLGEFAQPAVFKKVFDRAGNAAVTILDLGVDLHQSLFGFGRRNSFVCPQPLAGLGNVIFRDRNIDAEIDRNARLVGDLVAANLGDRPLEHLCIEIKAESVEMARLLAAEDVAGTAKFEIESRETKSGSEIGEFAYRDKRRRAIGVNSSSLGISRYA